jgi:PIN domain nuclease of toxin-antitoxin system
MKLLLDSNILIYAAQGKLSKEIAELITHENNRLFYSVASYWEVTIKYKSGKLALPVGPWVLFDGLLDNGYREVALEGRHVYTLGSLADIHKDPFDRIMVAQAITEDMLFLTTDELLGGYGQNVKVVRKS